MTYSHIDFKYLEARADRESLREFIGKEAGPAPPPGPARNRPLTGQHSCRQPAKVIVVKQETMAQDEWEATMKDSISNDSPQNSQ